MCILIWLIPNPPQKITNTGFRKTSLASGKHCKVLAWQSDNETYALLGMAPPEINNNNPCKQNHDVIQQILLKFVTLQHTLLQTGKGTIA